MTEKKQSFIEKVLDFLSGGEESVVKAIQQSAIKKWKRQIELKKLQIQDIERTVKYEISEQEEFLNDAKTALKEAYLDINSNIKGKTAIDNYIEEDYEEQIAVAKATVVSYTKNIMGLKSDSKVGIAILKKEIGYLEDDIKEIS